MSPILVLATVNAPHSKKLSAEGLVHCLLDHNAAVAVPGHMSSFLAMCSPNCNANLLLFSIFRRQSS